jgi:histidinol-phosphatase
VSLLDVRSLAHELADVADTLSLEGFRRRSDVSLKLDGSVVTETDLAIERALRTRILAVFPDHRVIGEEDGVSGDDPEAPTWILDPIDGTTNFVKGNPVFATLIAYAEAQQDMVGVVSAPALGTRWDGIVGEVARQDGLAIRVSPVASLREAEVSFGGLSDIEADLPGALAAFSRATVRQRGFGDFWGYCLVAAGSSDVVLEARLNRWDLAAVRCVVEAAGGRVTDLSGQPRSDGGSALATNGLLHDEALAIVRAHRRE